MNIPLLDLSAQHEALHEELMNACARVIRSGHFILGPEVQAFEQEVAAIIGVRHAIGMSSGSDALLAALMAIDLRPGDEVITTAYSFFATAGCIARLGARPVFVDVLPETLNIDPEHVADAVTSRTRAIIPVHLFGLPAEMDAINAVAKERHLTVIEDACQAIGASYRGLPIGTLGDMATFSFFPSKNLGGFGDGGLITTNDDQRATQLRQLRAHGSRVKYHHEVVGGNFRLDALQAALLRVKLPHLKNWTPARRENAARYDQLLADKAHGLRLPVDSAHGVHVYHQYVLRTPQRDQLRQWLGERGIATEVYYPVPLHLQPCFAELGYGVDSLPVAEQACREALALPMFPELRPEDQRAIAGAVLEFVSTASKMLPTADAIEYGS